MRGVTCELVFLSVRHVFVVLPMRGGGGLEEGILFGSSGELEHYVIGCLLCFICMQLRVNSLAMLHVLV